MAGPTPLTVTHRLVLHYTVSGFGHKVQHYCTAITSSDPSGFDLVGRPGGPGNVGVSTIMDAWAAAFAPFFNTAWASFDRWELQLRVGTAWTFLAAGIPTTTPSGSGGLTPANGWCVAGKDLNNRNIPAYAFEGNFRNTDKSNSYSNHNAAEKAVVDFYYAFGRAALVTDAWNWRQSRGAVYEGRWLASVWDSNEKLRRLRHIK